MEDEIDKEVRGLLEDPYNRSPRKLKAWNLRCLYVNTLTSISY